MCHATSNPNQREEKKQINNQRATKMNEKMKRIPTIEHNTAKRVEKKNGSRNKKKWEKMKKIAMEVGIPYMC